MSDIYVQEPPTSGKVVLKTTMGDLDIELWASEAPRTCRNFIQLCLEGYYDGTIFHRMVPGFMIQGGDPTGTGTGGESIYGKPFADEFHQRLKFSHRGIVAMANSGKPNDNGSQFFITFDQAQWLDKKHTIFGKIVGDTQYNLMAMQSLEVGKNDRPVSPPKILEAKVLVNPFDDIALRRTKKKAEAKVEETKKKEPPKPSANKKPTKNVNLLSFADGDEEEEEETDTVKPAYSSLSNSLNKKGKIVSSHDVLDDPKLLKEPVIPLEELEKKRKQKDEEEQKKKEFMNKVAEQGKKKRRFSDEDDSDSAEEDGNHKKRGKDKKGGATAESFDEEMRKGLVKKIQLMSKNNPEMNQLKIAENDENAELLGLKAVKNKKTGKIEFQWEKKDSSDESSSPASSSSFSTDSEKYNEEERELREKQKEEYDKLKVELLQFKKNKTGTASEAVQENIRQEKKLLSALETHRMKYLENKKQQRREADVMERLNEFKKKINGEVTNKKDEWLKSKLKFHIDSAKAYSHYESKEKSGNMESYMNPSKEFRERRPDEPVEEPMSTKAQDTITVQDLLKMTEEK